jgi:hypothetical protein
MAPSTPPPPRQASLAALTMAALDLSLWVKSTTDPPEITREKSLEGLEADDRMAYRAMVERPAADDMTEVVPNMKRIER